MDGNPVKVCMLDGHLNRRLPAIYL